MGQKDIMVRPSGIASIKSSKPWIKACKNECTRVPICTQKYTDACTYIHIQYICIQQRAGQGGGGGTDWTQRQTLHGTLNAEQRLQSPNIGDNI